MRFEILIQFIVPLMFLAIWALTSLLNRDAQPLPPRARPITGSRRAAAAAWPHSRPVRVPRPGMGGPVQAPGSSQLQQQRTMWPAAPPAAANMRERPVQRPPLKNMDDAIVYLENDPTRRGGGPARCASGYHGGGLLGVTPASQHPAAQGNTGPANHH